MSNTTLFLDASESFVQLLARVRAEQWEQPALGTWTVRSLAGHTARAILTVESYLGQDEPGAVTIPQMARAGIVLNGVFTFVIVLLAYFFGGPVFGVEPGVVPEWAVEA